VADATFTGTTTLDGAVVINESSADVDFRVESNGNANMLFVDGGNDTVAIGTSDTDFDPVADNLIVGTGTGSNGITIYTGSSAGNKGSIFFADTAAGNATNSRKGQITYEQNNEIMTFFTADTKAMEIGFIGAVNMPLQPAFLARPTSNQANLPINATTTIAFGTEIFDQNADFASNTFTAPVAGRYLLTTGLYSQSLDHDTSYYQLELATSNRVYYDIISMSGFDADVAYYEFKISVLADMDASDTAYVRMGIPNNGAAQVQIDPTSNFSGHLVC
jgi:prepilin-type processing-associated H-X9-DG protein